MPHPTSDPRGHSFGKHEPAVRPLDEATWRQNETWLFAIDLFNQGYYWEAHEAWESLWHACGRKGPTADLLKGLIKLAAAGVKAREARPLGVRRHAARAAGLFGAVQAAGTSADRTLFGLSLASLIAEAAKVPLLEILVRSQGLPSSDIDRPIAWLHLD
jgi:hypothetical protein